MTTLMIILSALMVLAAVWTIIASTLLVSAIALAAVSAVLTLLMFELGSPLAAIFELSVCAGLITVVLISAISLTARLETQAALAHARNRIRRYAWLPLVLIVAGGLLWLANVTIHLPTPSPADMPGGYNDVRQVLWNTRRFDLLGQLVIILTGVFGVVVLFKLKGPEFPNDEKTGEITQ